MNYEILTVDVTGLGDVSGTFYGFGYSTSSFDYFMALSPGRDSLLTDVGTYSVGVNVDARQSWSDTMLTATTTTPHTLVITPAELSATVQVTPSSADPQNTVVSMSLGGSWLSEVACCDYQTADGRAILNKIPAPPAGVWDMTITNASGEVIVEQQFEQVRGDQPSTVYLWTGAPIAESVTVEAIFTATGDEARNFTITQSSPVNFTTGEASRPVIELPVVPESPPVAEPAGVEISAWVLIALAIIGLGAGVSGVVLALRGRHAAAAAVAPGAHDEVDAPDAPDAPDSESPVSAIAGPVHRDHVVHDDGLATDGLDTDDVDATDIARVDTINESFGGWSLSTSPDVDGDESIAEKHNDD